MFRRVAAIFQKIRRLRPLRALLPIAVLHLLTPSYLTTTSTQPPVNAVAPDLQIEVLDRFVMKEEDLHKHLIVYQRLGHAKTDELAQELLDIYCHLFGNENMRVVVLQPDSSNTEELPPGFTVIRRYSKDIQFVDMGIWSSKASSLEEFYSLVMKQINKRLEEVPALSSTNLSKLSELVMPSSDLVIVLRTNKSSPNYIRERMNFEAFRQKTDVLSRNAKFCIVEDQQAAETLGLGGVKQGGISLLAPISSHNLKNAQSCKKVDIEGNPYCLLEDAQNHQSIKEHFIFVPYLNENPQYTIKLLVNFNKVSTRELRHLYSTFEKAQLEYPVKLVPTSRIDGVAVEMDKIDSDSDWIMLDKEPKRQLTAKEKTAILSEPKTWRFAEASITNAHLQEWVKRVKSGSEPPFYNCEKERPYERFSNKVVGSTFVRLLESPNDEVLFYYSRNCSSCKRFGRLYETLAKEYAEVGSPVHFNRLDNDKNKMKEGFNYNYTPVFAYFKKGHKQRPFIYKRQFFTQDYFRHFVELTGEIRVISDDRFEEAIQAATSL